MKKYLIIVLFLIIFLPTVSFAADISFDVNAKEISNNQDFLVQVMLDTKGESVNAVEGTISFSPESLELRQILDGNSSINFWLEKPHIVDSNKISFSGITSGGFSGPKILLFSLVFHSNHIGSAVLYFNDVQILANDGLGTKISVKIIPINLSIVDKKVENKDSQYHIDDNNPPEDFSPSISSDSDIFNGKKFLVFSTVDKGVGMDHYEVREDPFFSFWFIHDAYHVTDSPYLIKGQIFRGNIYIKAVDKNGNERIVIFNQDNTMLLLKQIVIFVIILFVCILFFRKIKLKFFRQ